MAMLLDHHVGSKEADGAADAVLKASKIALGRGLVIQAQRVRR